MSTKTDVIVIGAGLNGLTTACMLAKSGRQVTVVERRDVLGGLASRDEFAPGFFSPGVLHDTRSMSSAVIEALDLNKSGLEMRAQAPDLWSPRTDGSAICVPGAIGADVSGVGAKDVD